MSKEHKIDGNVKNFREVLEKLNDQKGYRQQMLDRFDHATSQTKVTQEIKVQAWGRILRTQLSRLIGNPAEVLDYFSGISKSSDLKADKIEDDYASAVQTVVFNAIFESVFSDSDDENYLDWAREQMNQLDKHTWTRSYLLGQIPEKY